MRQTLSDSIQHLAGALGSAVSISRPIVAAVLAIVFLSGCATLEEQPVENDVDDTSGRAERAMLDNMLSVLPQLLDPVVSTIQLGPDAAAPDAGVAAILADKGYGLQRVDADQGNNFFSMDVQNPALDSSGNNKTMRISIGVLELSRSYTIDGATIVPSSPMTLAGTRTRIELDDSAFGETIAGDSTVSSVEYAAAAPISGGIPTISLITDEVVQRVVDTTSIGPTYQALNSSKVEVSNLFYGGDSAFGSVFDNYNRIGREIVVFANDSMRLGRTGKRLIKQILDVYSEGSDVISIVGCSNGPTSLDIGNEGLALGRARRVSEELLSHGVPRDKVFDEGCWAPVSAGERFPSRGVVLDLWRRKS